MQIKTVHSLEAIEPVTNKSIDVIFMQTENNIMVIQDNEMPRLLIPETNSDSTLSFFMEPIKLIRLRETVFFVQS